MRQHSETIVLGLTARQLVCSAVAVGLAVGIYVGISPVIGRETASWLCLLAAAPFAAAGFFRYNGMTFEQFVAAWVKTSFLCGGERPFHSENVYYTVLARKERDDFD